jgi:uncharacterized delta-60 repeat protein
MSPLRRLAPLLVAPLLAAPAAAAAPPHAGSFDRGFGHNGRVTLNVAGTRIAPSALAVQPDRKILVAGTAVGAATSYPDASTGTPVALRFMPDGDLDMAFGDAGIARAETPAGIGIQGLALQPDGKLLLSGIDLTDPGARMGAVVRLLPSGRTDATFGTGGIAELPDPSAAGYYYGHVASLTQLGVQADGRILVAGTQDPSDVHSSADPYVARLMPNGAPDASFNEGGWASIGTANPIAVLAQPGGDMVVVGSDDRFFGGSNLTLLKIRPGPELFPYPRNPSPTLVSHQYRTSLVAVAAAVGADGAIDVIGDMNNYARTPHYPFLASARVGSDLQLLERGKVRTRGGVMAATFDARGAALTAGTWLSPYDPPPYRVERYRGMRRLDRSFGDREGKRYVYFRRPAQLLGMAMQGDKLIVAGYTYESERGAYAPSPRRLSLVRLYARQDGAGPRVKIRGLPRHRCLSGTQTLRVRIRDESRTRTRVRVGRHRLMSTTRKRFSVPLETTRMDAGRHRLTVRAVDAAGNAAAATRTIRVCG